MTKSELKDGYGVELRDGRRFIVFEGMLSNFKNKYKLRSWGDDLKRKERTNNGIDLSNLDIVKAINLNLVSLHNVMCFLNDDNRCFYNWNWERTEPKTGRVTLDNVVVGDEYWYADMYGDVCNHIHQDWESERLAIKNNPFGVWSTEEEAKAALDTYIEYKKRKKEPCFWCARNAENWFKWCPDCGRRLGVE